MCKLCCRNFRPSCDKCGPVFEIESTKQDLYNEQPYSIGTLPNCLRVGPSPIHGDGVFSTENIAPRTLFGPYEV